MRSALINAPPIALAALLLACQAPEPPLGQPSEPESKRASPLPLSRGAEGTRDFGTRAYEVVEVGTPEVLEALRGSGAKPRIVRRAFAEPSDAARLLLPIEAGRFTRSGGEALLSAIEALPDERRALGLGGLTLGELFGANGGPGLCEGPEIELETQLDGTSYELRYRVEPFTWFTDPVPALYALSSTCTAALLASGGTLPSAVGNGCESSDEQAHFPSGSTCRACLVARSGDHAACVKIGECAVEMTREMRSGNRWYDVLEARALACAPNLLVDYLILANELGPDNEVPAQFDHSAVGRLCYSVWSNTGPVLACAISDPNIRPALADILPLRVVYIRPTGTETQDYAGRLGLIAGAEVEGTSFTASPLFVDTIGPLSEPQMRGGWGLNPGVARPDGQSQARDYIAAAVLKTATTIPGVPIVIYNKNHCADGDWQGPDGQGRYFCRIPQYQMLPNDDLLWWYDWTAYFRSTDPPSIDFFPIVTLAATGTIDERIPGGHVPHLLGSPALADPDWEGCAWPDTFTPDEITTIDTLDGLGFTYTAQTYRFGKDPRVDIRMVLATSWRRGFCSSSPP